MINKFGHILSLGLSYSFSDTLTTDSRVAFKQAFESNHITVLYNFSLKKQVTKNLRASLSLNYSKQGLNDDTPWLGFDLVYLFDDSILRSNKRKDHLEIYNQSKVSKEINVQNKVKRYDDDTEYSNTLSYNDGYSRYSIDHASTKEDVFKSLRLKSSVNSGDYDFEFKSKDDYRFRANGALLFMDNYLYFSKSITNAFVLLKNQSKQDSSFYFNNRTRLGSNYAFVPYVQPNIYYVMKLKESIFGGPFIWYRYCNSI